MHFSRKTSEDGGSHPVGPQGERWRDGQLEHWSRVGASDAHSQKHGRDEVVLSAMS